MVVVISGGRKIRDMGVLERAIKASGFAVTIVVDGDGDGLDQLAKDWADKSAKPRLPFKAKWDDIHRPGAIVRKRKDGKLYDAGAGPYRNGRMSLVGEALIAIPEPGSRGTWDMVRKAEAENLKIYIHRELIEKAA